jgi:hypothetical protein
MGVEEEPAPVETHAAEAPPVDTPTAALSKPAEPPKPAEAPKVEVPPEAAAAAVDAPPAIAPAPTAADVARKPARNPWARPAPKNLAAARKAAASGDKGSERLIAALRKYNREHQMDPRGHLVLALIFRNRNWRDDTLKQYETALERDIRARGTPEMLRDLLQIVAAGESTGERATQLIRTVYGSEALPTIDQMLETSKVDAAGRLRWEALRALIAPN